MSGDSAATLRLRDIRREIASALDAVAGLDFETFSRSWILRRACERAIEIISEASRHLPPEVKTLEPDIPWRQIAGIGNVLRHGYEKISDRVTWDILARHLEPLDRAVLRLLAGIDSGPDSG
jgi:uncharacterized protein with HEPN domain